MKYSQTEAGLTPRTKRLWQLHGKFAQYHDKYLHWTQYPDNKNAGTKDKLEKAEHKLALRIGRNEARNQR